MICKCAEIDDYIELVRHGEYPSCPEQFAFCDLIERVFSTEKLMINYDQLGAFMKLQKHFPYALFEWEKCIFALHNCVYTQEGFLRFPDVLSLCGRGAGKTGYMSFEGFANLTPVSGVKNYEIDIFATSEKQSKTSFMDVYNILESKPDFYKKYFYWNKELIVNLKTKNSIQYNTASPKTKDGYRPGMLYFDEYHAYENEDLIEVAESGLGKLPFPKKGIFTTDGRVRGGPLDTLKIRANNILFKGEDDLGLLPFICKLPEIDMVHDSNNWHMANPSLRYFPELFNLMKKEYASWVLNPSPTKDFIVKRMNIPPQILDDDVTDWENVKATDKEVPDLTGCQCVAAIDYAKTTDFVAAGLLFKYNGVYYWLTHSWVCSRSADLHRIKAPLKEWEAMGLLTFVDAPEIAPEVPISWFSEMSKKYVITRFAMDNFRITLFCDALRRAGFDINDKGKVILVKKVTEMRYAPVIESAFANHNIAFGNNPLMRWYTNNTCKICDKNGNFTFGKKEAKSRKTDGFKAMVAAFCASDGLQDSAAGSYESFDVYSY